MSLVDTLKNRVFQAVDSVKPASMYKVLVIDKHVEKIFSYILDKNELLNRQVSSVEILDSKRESQGYMEAVYMFKPDKYTIDCLLTDFIKSPARYACAHLFLLPGLTKELDMRLKNSPAGRFVRQLDVKYMDFFPMESQLFTLDEPFSGELFYNTACGDLVKQQIASIAKKLVSVCATLGEYPIVRFQKANENYGAHVLPYMVAEQFQKELDSYARNDRDFPVTSEGRPRAQFLILDRAIDTFAPLLHEFTYQAMVYDMLPIKGTNRFVYKPDSGGTDKETVEGVLSDKDSEWVALRHMHMQDAIDSLTTKLDKFKKENPHLVDSSTTATVTDLQDMVANLPMFTEMKERFALHLQMANECMDMFQKRNLGEVSEVEQTCSTGVGSDGKRNKNLTDDLIRILVTESMTRQDKVRLLGLYALYRGGLIKEDYKKIQQHCGLDEFDLQVIENLALIGSPTVKQSPKDKKTSKEEQPTRFHGQATGDVYETSRYVPGVKNIVEQLILSTLDARQFPYTKDEPGPDADGMDQPSSLRNPRQRAAWAKTSSANQVKQRIYVFVVGGVTQSEVRSAYELSKQHSKEVIIGGTSVLTPAQFLGMLGRLTAPRNRLNLPMDQPLPRAPDYLMASDKHEKPPPPPQAQGQPRAPNVQQSQGRANMPSPVPSQASSKKSSSKLKDTPPAPSVSSVNEALGDPSASGAMPAKKEKKKFKFFK